MSTISTLVSDEVSPSIQQQKIAPSRPVRILQAVGGLNRGGIETWALNVAKNVDRDRYQIDFLVDTTQNYAYNDEIRATGAAVLPCLNYTHPPVYWDNLKAIYKQHGPYDVVHSHVHYFSGLILTMAAMLKVRHRIVHVHPAVDLKAPSLGRSLYRAAMMAALRKNATSVLACSETSLGAFIEACRPKTQVRQVLYNGVDLSPYQRQVNRDSIRMALGLPRDKFLISYVARFVPHKNHAQIIRLAPRLQAVGLPVHFALVGSHGSILNDLRQQVALQSNVSLLLGLPDVTDVLLASDAFFFPSLEEGFGVVALEAAAAGLPVVASDFSTIREAVSPAQREFMFPPDNDEIALQQLIRLITNEPMRRRLADDSRDWAGKFTIEQSVSSLMGFYDSLLKQ
jgi:glycosyltransferase involved in cell wall biosynthesis